MGQDSPPTSPPHSRHEPSLLSRQPLLATPSQRWGALLLSSRPPPRCLHLGVGPYASLTSSCPLPLVAMARRPQSCNWSQRANIVAVADWRQRRIVVVGSRRGMLWCAAANGRVLLLLLWQFAPVLIVTFGISGEFKRVSVCPILFF